MDEPHGQPGRKSAKRLSIEDEIELVLRVRSAKVLDNQVSEDSCEIRIGGFELRNIFTTNVGDAGPTETTAPVFLAGTIDSPELIVQAGPAQRFLCRGLSDADRRKLATAPTKQIAEMVGDRDERERSAVAGQLLASLSPTERERLLLSISDSPEEPQ